MTYLAILALSLVVILLVGCGPSSPRPQQFLDVQSSYYMTRTDAPTLPRAYTSDTGKGAKYTASDIAAVRALGIGVTEASGAPSQYVANLINIKPGSPRFVLLHEVAHAGQADSGHTCDCDWWANEAGAMVVEVSYLMSAGWSDYEIRNLTWNNAHTPDWVYAWIREHGPKFTGGVSDMEVAYAWGKDSSKYDAVKADLLKPSN